MERIYVDIEKRYTYSTTIQGRTVKVEFIWDGRMRMTFIIAITVFGEPYDLPDYNPFSYINSARVFLKTVRDLERIHTLKGLRDYLEKLGITLVNEAE
jgi:hypothetical protein